MLFPDLIPQFPLCKDKSVSKTDHHGILTFIQDKRAGKSGKFVIHANQVTCNTKIQKVQPSGTNVLYSSFFVATSDQSAFDKTLSATSSPLSKQHHKYEIENKKHPQSKLGSLLTYEYSSTVTSNSYKITSVLNWSFIEHVFPRSVVFLLKS